jgi:multicomponent K+:H+ antiporter subunit G
MTAPSELPVWAALLTAFLLLVGSAVTLIGSVGLLRLKSFYHRVHAPTLGTTIGIVAIGAASVTYFSVLGSRIAAHEILIAVFVTVTTPVTLMLLARAALHRDRTEGNTEVPGAHAMAEVENAAVRTD